MQQLILAALVGGLVTYAFEKRKQRFAKNLDDKRAIYGEFTSIVIDLFKRSKKNVDVANETAVDDELLDRFYEFYKKFVLYASSKSIDAFGDWMSYLRTDTLDNRVWISKLSMLLGSMRKDLGLSNFYLGVNNIKLLRAIFTDYDEVFGGQSKKVDNE